MIAFSIDLDRINQARIFTGKTGRRYLSFMLIHGPDQYGNAGQVVHSISREERAGGGFGMSRSLAYVLTQEGLIQSVSIRRPDALRGKRLWRVSSIRRYLNELERKQRAKKPVPHGDGGGLAMSPGTTPKAHLAYRAVALAIKSGELRKQPCEVCGAGGIAHHDDYDKPLNVRWLCNSHHMQLHASRT